MRSPSMAGGSYATAASMGPSDMASTTTTTVADNKTRPYELLLKPTPISFPLIASLQLIRPIEIGDTIYLLPTSIVQNWLFWAFQQHVPPAEGGRVREALRQAASHYGLIVPTDQSAYSDPGPIDARALTVPGHPMVLLPTVRIRESNKSKTGYPPPSSRSPKAQRSNSAMGINSTGHQKSRIPKKNNGMSPHSSPRTNGMDNIQQFAVNGHSDAERKDPECIAVPEAFYETIRSVQGVVCQDGFTVSFQSPISGKEAILLDHEVHINNTFLHIPSNSRDNPRPVEFRRKVIAEPLDERKKRLELQESSERSLMERLMLEEQFRNKANHLPIPEVHPIKLLYRLDMGDMSETENLPISPRQLTHDGFVLVSQDANASDALTALLRVAAPRAANQTVRLWSQRKYPYEGSRASAGACAVNRATNTSAVESFELIDLAQMIQLDSKSKQPTTMGDWVQRHSVSGKDRQVECLLEFRHTVNHDWPRDTSEMMQRVQVGDFCDAQDVQGKWYEAVVLGVTDTQVEVHYLGWASRWNARLKRFPGTTIEGLANKLHPPAPLWSQTFRWRERVAVGDVIEVRDSSSLVQRPKWYKGEVKKIGKPADTMHPLTGGADLEQFPVVGDGAKKEPLLLLGRGQQILVEVRQERTEKAGTVGMVPGEGDLAAGLNPQPPFLRWVNLYGEEVCQLGTHLKVDDEMKSPAVLRYEFESGRKPVEIMKSHSSLGGSGFMRESLRGTPPAPGSVGLQNLGNSCFLNSTVQCLNHMQVLTQYFLKDQHAHDLNTKNPLGSGGNVALAYSSLMKQIWSGDYSILAPRKLKQTVAAFAPQFDNSYQHDSQEFCQFLMDGLHEDLNRVKIKPYVEELEGFGMEDQKAAIESWRKHLLRHDSIVVDHCQGMHRSHLTCPQCGRESIKFDVFSSISLPLAAKKDHSTIQLRDCIDLFMEGEQLDERNAWYCPSCRRHVCALKMIALWSAPDILILHLKRFTFDTCMASGGMLRSKVDDTVEFPIDRLDMTNYILGPLDPDAPPVYRLFGVSEHRGATANSGHYTATIRNSVDDQWYRFNDSHVGRTSGEASMTGGAYVLFYQRTNGSSRWAGMEKVMKERNINPYGGLDVDQDGFKKVKTKKKKK